MSNVLNARALSALSGSLPQCVHMHSLVSFNGSNTLRRSAATLQLFLPLFCLQTLGIKESFIFQRLMKMVQSNGDYKNTISITNPLPESRLL